MSKEQKTIYEKHPVSPERKVELRAEGYRIIDARFAPADYKHPHAKAQKDSDQGGQGDKQMTVPQIKDALAAKGVTIPDGVTKRDDLKALLDAAGEQGTDKGE